VPNTITTEALHCRIQLVKRKIKSNAFGGEGAQNWLGNLLIVKSAPKCILSHKIPKLENVAIANALQLEAARSPTPRSPCPLYFCLPLPSLNSLSLSVVCLERFYCLYVMLRCDLELRPRDLDLWRLPLNICSRRDSARSNSVRNLSEIGQFAAELLQFEYLTLWPWTCITCCAMLWNSLHKVYTQSSYEFMKCNNFWC